MTPDNIKNIFVKCMERHDLFKWGFDLELNHRCYSHYAACVCGDGKMCIIANTKALKNKKGKFIEDVALHEVAHALDFITNGLKWRYTITKSGKKRYLIHDQVWKDICIKIGASPEISL